MAIFMNNKPRQNSADMNVMWKTFQLTCIEISYIPNNSYHKIGMFYGHELLVLTYS